MSYDRERLWAGQMNSNLPNDSNERCDALFLEPLGVYLVLTWQDDLVSAVDVTREPPRCKSSPKIKNGYEILRNEASLPLDLSCLTPFQKSVFGVVAKIPFGKTMTYGEVARKVAKPGASRAVGQALRSNLFPVLIPCHRVVGARTMGGYRWGEEMKKQLLELERDFP